MNKYQLRAPAGPVSRVTDAVFTPPDTAGLSERIEYIACIHQATGRDILQVRNVRK